MEQERSWPQKGLLALKGVAMGAADVVPGVSGGTIAFITGIYEELISSINEINLGAIKVLRKEGFVSFWKHINGTFFILLFSGIAFSVLSLAKIVLYLLETHPVLIWSFFFGLIIASTILVGKTISKWSNPIITFFTLGTLLALYISSIQTVASVDATWYIFLSGCIAICAMILPGISGSFILVLLGSYHVILGALESRQLGIIAVFMAGCLVGILSFARLLKYLFAKFKEVTIAVLTGFMLGSLYKVWPWKINIGSAPLVIHSNGKEDWMTRNVLPSGFEGNPQVLVAILCMVFGLALVLVLEKIGKKYA
jgi:putative membrane protein